MNAHGSVPTLLALLALVGLGIEALVRRRRGRQVRPGAQESEPRPPVVATRPPSPEPEPQPRQVSQPVVVPRPVVSRAEPEAPPLAPRVERLHTLELSAMHQLDLLQREALARLAAVRGSRDRQGGDR